MIAWLLGAVLAVLPLLPASHLHEDSAATPSVVHRHLPVPAEHPVDHDTDAAPLADEDAWAARPMDIVVVTPPNARSVVPATVAARLASPSPPVVLTMPPLPGPRVVRHDISPALPSRAPPSSLSAVI